MKLEKQVTSLKPSKKLEKLGVKQESHWYWVKHKSQEKSSLMEVHFPGGYTNLLKAGVYEIFSAFTVAELGERLAKAFNQLPGTMINDPSERFKRLWIKLTGFENEAENRAKMLIYLKENNLIR